MSEAKATGGVGARGLEYTDTDGVVMKWDGERRAYFPAQMVRLPCSMRPLRTARRTAAPRG